MFLYLISVTCSIIFYFNHVYILKNIHDSQKDITINSVIGSICILFMFLATISL